jgi:hypothetical protein
LLVRRWSISQQKLKLVVLACMHKVQYCLAHESTDWAIVELRAWTRSDLTCKFKNLRFCARSSWTSSQGRLRVYLRRWLRRCKPSRHIVVGWFLRCSLHQEVVSKSSWRFLRRYTERRVRFRRWYVLLLHLLSEVLLPQEPCLLVPIPLYSEKSLWHNFLLCLESIQASILIPRCFRLLLRWYLLDPRFLHPLNIFSTKTLPTFLTLLQSSYDLV